MADSKISGGIGNRTLIGFIAGFLSTLTFHQGALWVLWGMGVAPFGPFSMAPVPPFGVPAVLSLAFWGGVWGILFAHALRPLPRTGYWLSAFLFGAVLASLVALFIVAPLKGRPVAGGWQPAVLITAFLINGMWGLGTGVWIELFQAVFKRRQKRLRCPPGAVCDY